MFIRTNNAVNRFCSTMFLVDSVSTYNNGVATTTEVNNKFTGRLQPAQPEDLIHIENGEGTKSWKVYVIFTNSKLNFRNGEHILVNNVRYRIHKNLDYSQFGHKKITVTEAYV